MPGLKSVFPNKIQRLNLYGSYYYYALLIIIGAQKIGSVCLVLNVNACIPMHNILVCAAQVVAKTKKYPEANQRQNFIYNIIPFTL